MRTTYFFFGVVFLLTSVAFCISSQAATYTVTSTGDEGAGSLREAIDFANGNGGMDTIEFDIPGAGPHTIQPDLALPVIEDPVIIDGYTQPGASPNTNPVGQGLNTVLMIELDGSNAVGAVGLEVRAGNSTIRGLAINNFEAGAIWIHTSDGNVIEGNFIGTNTAGTNAAGYLDGILIWNSFNTIGGTTAAARNLISGNEQSAIFMDAIESGGASNVIQGNLIGTDISGTVSLGNLVAGISIFGGGNNTIGGTDPGTRNVISGSGWTDVLILDETATNNVVQGNFIGTDVTGTSSLSDAIAGVVIQQQASDNTIGGSVEGAGNVISGTNEYGIHIAHDGTRGNQILGNFIGTDHTGTVDLGTDEYGVRITEGASDNRIGGMSDDDGNTIAFNDDGGVLIDSGSGNAVLSNSIFSNGGLGINLGSDGVTPNDDGDGDTGANNLQNFPVLTLATTDQVEGTINSTPNTEFSLDFFSNTECDPTGYGEGETYLGDMVVPTDGEGNANFRFLFPSSVPEGQFITATATDVSLMNTSEFSQCLEVGELCVIILTSPDGGETWDAGETETITWTSDGTSGTVILEYSIDGGYHWAVISGGTEDDGSYDWDVPGTPSEQCQVMVCDAGDSTCCDRSDEYFIIHADCDFAITHIAISNPVSVGYPATIQVAITNLSQIPISLGDAWLDILNEGGQSIFFGDLVLMDRLLPDPFFLFPPGDTMETYQYNWFPEEVGNYSIKVLLDFPCDTLSINNSLTIGPVTVSESGTGFLAYFDLYSTEHDTIYFDQFRSDGNLIASDMGIGPAVRFSVPEDMPGARIHTLKVGVALDSGPPSPPGRGGGEGYQRHIKSASSFWVYVLGSGENDSTFGNELIEPFEFTPSVLDSLGQVVIDLTDTALVSPEDYEKLVGLSGDFWVHLKVTDQAQIGFIAHPALPDTGTDRNWIFEWGTLRGNNEGTDGTCPPPGWMDPFDKGWKELIGLDFSLCLLERGDVNWDGDTNVLDVLAVINHILDLVPITDNETLCRADCNGDGIVNILDALGIVNVILGIGECEH